jgi:hypothetical protein
MRALARPVSGADDALTSITCGRPAPYGAASYGAASYGGAAYGEGVSGGDGGVQRHLGVRTGPSERFRRSGRDRRGERNPGERARRRDPPGPGELAGRRRPGQRLRRALPWPPQPDETPGGHRPGRKAGALVILADGELILASAGQGT